MSVNPDYLNTNAERQVNDPNSTYNFWASVLRLRKHELDIFVYGDYRQVDRDSEEVFAFVRGGKVLVLANFTDKEVEWDSKAHGVRNTKEVLINNYEGAGTATRRILTEKWILRPYEAIVVMLDVRGRSIAM